jgi:hypothetical protein
MLVVKLSMNAETSGFLCNPCHFADALYTEFLSALIRRRNQNFNPNVRPHWRCLGTEDQSTIQRNVVREASLGVLPPIIPVENDGELEPVSNSASALQAGLNNWGEIHM